MSDEIAPDAGEPGNPKSGEVGLPSMALVEIADGLAVVVGDHVPDGLDLIPLTLLSPAARSAVSTSVGTAVGLGNISAQGLNAAMQAQGVVHLAPQTIAALKTASPIVKDGWNLGTLATGGKFAASVRWLPATAATTASVVAGMGSAVSLMIIQAQLNQIADLAQHNLELTSTVLEVVRRDQWSAVSGHYKTLVKELEHARQTGAVTDHIYEEVRGYQGELTSRWDAYRTAVQQHAKALQLRRGHQDRQKYLVDNGQAIIADAQALLLAQTSWFIHQALRVGHLSLTADTNPHDEILLKTLVGEAQSLHEKALDDTNWLLDQLAREFAIIGELPGKKTFKIGASARAAEDATRMVRELQEALASIRGKESPEVPQPLALPSIRVFEEKIPLSLTRILPLRLEPSERVLALADASCDGWAFGSGWLALTDQRLLVTKQDSLRKLGAIDIAINTDDIRYVRRYRPAKGVLRVDVITKSRNLTLRFPAEGEDSRARQDAGRLGQLLASFMNLPESEVPTVLPSELLEASGTTIDAIDSQPNGTGETP